MQRCAILEVRPNDLDADWHALSCMRERPRRRRQEGEGRERTASQRLLPVSDLPPGNRHGPRPAASSCVCAMIALGITGQITAS
jgi:hypothetical protein